MSKPATRRWCSWRLRPGNLVRIFSFVTHRDPRWFPDPDRFDPERWTPERADGLPQFAYFPFGGGPRVCIGKEFALMEMGLVVATLPRRFEASPAPGQGEPAWLPHLSLRPNGGWQCGRFRSRVERTNESRRRHGHRARNAAESKGSRAAQAARRVSAPV